MKLFKKLTVAVVAAFYWSILPVLPVHASDGPIVKKLRVKQGPWWDIFAHSTLASAVAAAASDNAVILVQDQISVPDNVTIPATASLWILGNGQLSVGAGATITATYVHGEGVGLSKITKTGAGYALKGTTNAVISGLQITGDNTAGGGIDWSGVSIGSIANCRIEGFTASGAKAFNNDASFRTELRNVWIANNAIALYLKDNSSFYMRGGALYGSTEYAILTAGSDAQGVFDGVDISSNTGQVTVLASGSGASNGFLVFRGHTRFEDNGGTNANAKTISVRGSFPVTIEGCNFSEPRSTVTGTYTDIDVADAHMVNIVGNYFAQNTAAPGYARAFIGGTAHYSVINRIGNIFSSNTLSPESVANLFGFYSEYSPNMSIVGDRISGIGGAGTIYLNQRVPLDSSMTSVGLDNTDEKTLASKILYQQGNYLGVRGGIKVFAAGYRSGTAGSKTIKLYFGSSSWTLISNNSTTDWRIEATIYNDGAHNSQRISWVSHSGTAVSQGYETAAISTYDNVTVKVTGQVTGAGDNIVKTMWLVY